MSLEVLTFMCDVFNSDVAVRLSGLCILGGGLGVNIGDANGVVFIDSYILLKFNLCLLALGSGEYCGGGVGISEYQWFPCLAITSICISVLLMIFLSLNLSNSEIASTVGISTGSLSW